MANPFMKPFPDLKDFLTKPSPAEPGFRADCWSTEHSDIEASPFNIEAFVEVRKDLPVASPSEAPWQESASAFPATNAESDLGTEMIPGHEHTNLRGFGL